MKIAQLKNLVAAGGGLTLLATIFMVPGAAQSEIRFTDVAADYDAAANYTSAKCVVCHGQKAEKKFDSTLADAALVEIVLKGKKADKPPNMPAYEAKGITADQAKALVAYMKSLK
jgi:mono/diheme cytochrome c family protein